MCLNCGCGEPETRHQETDITADNVRKAAAGKPVDQTVRNMQAGLDSLELSPSRDRMRFQRIRKREVRYRRSEFRTHTPSLG